MGIQISLSSCHIHYRYFKSFNHLVRKITKCCIISVTSHTSWIKPKQLAEAGFPKPFIDSSFQVTSQALPEGKKNQQTKNKIQISLCINSSGVVKHVANFEDLSGMKKGVMIPWQTKMKICKCESIHTTLC